MQKKPDSIKTKENEKTIDHLPSRNIRNTDYRMPGKKTEKITVNWATFNIRYDNPADSLNNWKYRKDTIAAFIKANQLDIVGMQEVLHNQLEDLKQRLPEYAEVGVGREDGKTQGEYAPLFYRKNRFEALDSNTFWLSQYPDSVGFIGWDGACTALQPGPN